MPAWLERAKNDFLRRRITAHDLDEMHDAAVKAAIKDQEAAGLDVEPGGLLILDRRLHGRVVHLVEVVGGDPPPEEIVLRTLEPRRHRVAADECGRKVLDRKSVV